MTVPNERSNAVRKARRFLRDLLDPRKTPRVPKWIRKEAYWALRHYPSDHDIERASEVLPDIFGEIEREKYDL